MSGGPRPTRLPHSGFTAFIATREFVRPSGDPRPLPLVPDIIVPRSAVEGGDNAILARAVEWLGTPR